MKNLFYDNSSPKTNHTALQSELDISGNHFKYEKIK